MTVKQILAKFSAKEEGDNGNFGLEDAQEHNVQEHQKTLPALLLRDAENFKDYQWQHFF